MRAAVQQPQGVQSVEIGFRVLDAIAGFGGAVSLTILARALEMPPSKVHRYLASLARCGLISQEQSNGRYDLGPSALALGARALSRIDGQRIAAEEARRLGTQLDHNVFIAVWSHEGPVVVGWHDAGRPITVMARLGGRLPATRSGTGRVFLAFRGRAEVERFLGREHDPKQPLRHAGRVLSRDQFLRLLEDIRRRRMARVAGDLVRGVDALSAPIFDITGTVTMVMTVMANQGDLDVVWDGAPARALKEAAARISRQLGYEGEGR